MFTDSIKVQFADLLMGFYFPTMIEIPKEFLPFICETSQKADVEYAITLLNSPLQMKGECIARYNGIEIYEHEDGWIRNYRTLTEKDGCQVACYLNAKGKNLLYYPAAKWNHYAKELHCLHLIAVETVLLKYDALLLHSSVVKIDGKTILFSGPSGVGKSTQALLWKKYMNAQILNGDRCIVRRIDNQFYGCGSPWAGTSGIYNQEMAPIAGIIFLKQGNKNMIKPLLKKSFLRLYEQSIINAWDRLFVEKISLLIGDMINDIPVYELECMPDEEAVKLTYETLVNGGRI